MDKMRDLKVNTMKSFRFVLLEVIDRVRVDAVPDLAKWLKPVREDTQNAETFEDECRCVLDLMDVVRDYGYAMYTIDRLWLNDMADVAQQVLTASDRFCEHYDCGTVLTASGWYVAVASENGIDTYARYDESRDMDDYGGCIGENGIVVINDICECKCADDHLPRHRKMTAFGLWACIHFRGNLQEALEQEKDFLYE